MKKVLLFICLAILWSGSFICIKIAVEHFPPIFSALIRVLIAFMCLSLLFIAQRKTILAPVRDMWKLWVTGTFTQGLPFAFLFYGERTVAPALASILNSTVSLWALLLGALLFRDISQWTPKKILGLCLGFGGVIFIFYPMLDAGESKSTLIGTLSIMAMAVCYAVGALLNQHLVFGKLKTTIETNLWQQHLSSMVLLTALSFMLEPAPVYAQFLNLKVLGAFLYLGVLSTALAWIIYFYLIKHWGAVRASSVMYIVPVLAILWDYLFLHRAPAWNEAAGAAAILAGVILIQWVRQRPL